MESLLAAVRHCGTEDPVRSLLSAPHVAAEVNKQGPSGVNALGLAVWRNHAGLVEALLEAGADPDATDSESGWSALHRALHWGQLRVAAALLRANASLAQPDWRGRTPLDLLSAELKEYLGPGDGDVFSWGNGSNYTLGTASTDIQEHPARVESLHDQQVVAISAAKFHSVAVTADGQLLTWGWGRGGRLGHPEAHVHSGEGAVIAPLVVAALGRRQVAAVAAGKHHTVLCTTAGEVFTCGSNRHGQLGYAVDSQPTPRRVSALRQRVVAVAAANKHSVAVTAGGDVFTWGCNELGQLGYGTSDSASNPTPRLVEAMRGKPVVAAAAAKRHTLVLTASGEVYSWGHRGVSPRRVQLSGARDAAALCGAPLAFHRGHADVARPVAAAICAGAAHSSALTATGVVLTWRSADPALQVQEVGGALAGKRVVSIAAGKYRTAAVSDEGDVYMWEGRSDYFPAEGRQPGSGSKKRDAGSASRARPIPGGGSRAGGGAGADASLLGGSYGSADVHGGSWGSYSHSRRPGSWIERFAQERDAAGPGLSAGAPASYGVGSNGRTDVLGGGSASKPSRASDAFERIRPERVEGLKRAIAVAVGEKHSLALQRWSAAQLDGITPVPWLQPADAGVAPEAAAFAEDDALYQHAADGLMDGSALVSPREDEFAGSPAGAAHSPSPVRPGPQRQGLGAAAVGVPSLQRICEEEVARRLVDPRTCLQVLEYADVAGADTLRSYCLAVAVCNLDAVLLEAGGAFDELAPHLLAELEQLYKLRLTGAGGSGAGSSASGVVRGLAAALQEADQQPEGSEDEAAAGSIAAEPPRAGSRLQPGRRPTRAAAWLGDDGLQVESGLAPSIALPPTLAAGGSSFRDRSELDAEAAVQRLQRTLQKKLQQIEHLAAKAGAGEALDAQQRFKLEQKPVVLSALAALEGGMAVEDVQSILRAASAAREPGVDAAAAASSSGGACKADAAQGSAPASGSKQKGKAKRSVQQDTAPFRSAQTDAAAQVEAAEPATAAALEEEREPFRSVPGTSPPADSQVSAFGADGSAAGAAAGPCTPSAADEAAIPPPQAQMRSLVGFASASSSDGVGAVAAAQPGMQQPVGRPPAGAGRPKSASKRKGGLSMFLRGELEQQEAPAPAAVPTSSAGAAGAQGPAWGSRAPAPPSATSLKDILYQEASGSASKAPTSVQRATPGSGAKARPPLESPGAAPSSSGGALRLSLASFMQSSPLAMQRGAGRAAAAAASPPPPAWGGASGASPPGRGGPSFRAIQEQQEALQEAQQPPPRVYSSSPPLVQRPGPGLPAWRPPAPAPSASLSLLGSSPSGSGSLLGTSPLGRGGSFQAAPILKESKWYIPEGSRVDTRKSLLSIQSEEAAMAELAAQGVDSAHAVPKQERRTPKPPRPSKPAAAQDGSGGGGNGAAQGADQAAQQQQAQGEDGSADRPGSAPAEQAQRRPRKGGDRQQKRQAKQEGGDSGAGKGGEAHGQRPAKARRPNSGKPKQQEGKGGDADEPGGDTNGAARQQQQRRGGRHRGQAAGQGGEGAAPGPKRHQGGRGKGGSLRQDTGEAATPGPKPHRPTSAGPVLQTAEGAASSSGQQQQQQRGKGRRSGAPPRRDAGAEVESTPGQQRSRGEHPPRPRAQHQKPRSQDKASGTADRGAGPSQQQHQQQQ